MRSVAEGGIGIGAAPGQNGSAVNDEIACPHETPMQRQADHDDKEGFSHGGARPRCSFPLL